MTSPVRTFNTTGPMKPERHYCIPPLQRLDMDDVHRLVRDEKYFVLHAPRQTGKTTALLALADVLNGQGYRCVYATVESARTARGDMQRTMQAVLGSLASAANVAGDAFLAETWPGVLAEYGPHLALGECLARWARTSDAPLVVLLDEVDTLQGDALLGVLQQLRAGYPSRPNGFPQSVLLCGMRDLRDYQIESTGSPFNIAARSLRLGDFTEEDVHALLGQHTVETGQSFAPAALDVVWRQTRGQPWLVNALAELACFDGAHARNWSRDVQAEDIIEAREELLGRRVTHLRSLAERLREDRIRRVVEPLLTGDDRPTFSDDDLEYAQDLGLIALDDPLRIANPIYAEVIPRELTVAAQRGISAETAWYVDENGGLDVPAMMRAFQAFFRRHSEHWRQRFHYQEAWPQLLLQAYLHRIVNGGGRIEREYGLGRGRVDLLLVWPAPGGVQEFLVECKVLREHDGTERVIAEGVRQTAEYAQRSAAASAHLVLFDRREDRPWEEKLFHRTERATDGTVVEVWGM